MVDVEAAALGAIERTNSLKLRQRMCTGPKSGICIRENMWLHPHNLLITHLCSSNNFVHHTTLLESWKGSWQDESTN